MKRIWIGLLLSLALFSCDTKAPPASTEVGQKAPDFKLKDLEGKSVSLASFQNKVVLIEFWASWCPPCLTSIPELEELDRSYRDKNFVLLAVSLDEGRNVQRKLTDFVAEHGITYRVLISDDLTSRLYGITSIPVMYLLDKQHVITKRYTGYSPEMLEELSREIETLL